MKKYDLIVSKLNAFGTKFMELEKMIVRKRLAALINKVDISLKERKGTTIPVLYDGQEFAVIFIMYE